MTVDIDDTDAAFDVFLLPENLLDDTVQLLKDLRHAISGTYIGYDGDKSKISRVVKRLDDLRKVNIMEGFEVKL